MSSHRAEDASVVANVAYYGDGSEVSSYQKERYHSVRLDRAADVLESRLRPSSRVADLGAGSTVMADRLSLAGHVVTLVDASQTVVGRAVDSGHEAASFDLSDRFPWEAEVFDGLFAGEIIEHLFDPIAFLSECHRVLKRNGILVLTTPNLATAQDRLQFFVGKGPRQVDPLHSYLRFHIRPFTPRRLNEALEAGGFEPFELQSNAIPIRFESGRRVYLWKFAEWFPALGGSLILGARRLR